MLKQQRLPYRFPLHTPHKLQIAYDPEVIPPRFVTVYEGRVIFGDDAKYLTGDKEPVMVVPGPDTSFYLGLTLLKKIVDLMERGEGVD